MIPPDPRHHRIARRHHLHPDHRADTIAEATAGVVVLHATDPASVFLGLRARTHDVSVADIEHSLYEERSLVRVLAMRRTLFATRAVDAAIPFAACSLRVAEQQRRALATQLGRGSDVEDPVSFIQEAMDVALEAIEAGGEVSARSLTAAHPILQTRWNPAPDSKWGASSPITSRVLSQLDMEGLIERAQATGADFTSTAYRWRRTDPALVEAAHAIDPDEARVSLLTRWLGRFGPATEDDLVWWTGLTKTLVRRALSSIDAESRTLHGRDGLCLTGDTDDQDPGPWVSLLPGLDPTAMGWRHRDWYVGEHTAALFDRAGNIGPTIWADGRVVGGWTQRSDGGIAWRTFEDLDADHHDLLEIERAGVSAFLGDIRVTPRFRTPLERELAA